MHDSKAVKIYVARLGAWQKVKKKWLMTAEFLRLKPTQTTIFLHINSPLLSFLIKN